MTSNRAWTEAELRAALDRYEEELRRAGKARNTVTTYVQHPERFINWLVGRYDAGKGTGSDDSTPAPTGPRSTYEPLSRYLSARDEPVIRMTFAEIESVLGRPLPASARRYRPWWANERDGTHVHARSWLGAGRRTSNIDLSGGTVEFTR